MSERETLLRALEEVDEDIDYTSSQDLIGDGTIDSFMLTQIIASLDDAFDIHIDLGEIEPENFRSVDAMLELVRRCGGTA